MFKQTRAAAAACALILAGCNDGGVSGPAGPAVTPKDRFGLANGCFVVKADGAYVVRDGADFAATATDATAAERFFMKAAGLGRYIFYTSDGQWMTGSGTAVSAASAPEDGSDWTVEGTPAGFTAKTLDAPLSLDGTAHFALGGTASQLVFEPYAGCVEYPEMPVGISASTYRTARNKPVIGFAEVHSHMGMGSEMSDGAPQNHVGPSAGGVMYGQAMNRFGVIEALNDCTDVHGPDGTLSPENIVLDQDPTETHDTQGWPTFVDWPKNDSQLHQQMYYKWVERAYKAGLRTMTIHGTNIEALCNVAVQTGGNKDPDVMDEDCVDMSVGEKQIDYVHAIQDYIDAQEGGPGKGWFRIVMSPAEARDVIAEGKLAVITGLEFSNLFGCTVTFAPDGSETSGCTKEQIDAGVEEAWNRGIRQIFAYHDVDSALGGTGIFSFALDLVGYYGTHGFWKTYDCADGGEGPAWFYDGGTYMYSDQFPAGFGSDPITLALIEATQGTFPLYPSGKRQCNARGVTDLGMYALDRLMRKGFVLDIDHSEVSIKQYMLDQGKLVAPNYPMLSAHGGHGGITDAQATQMIKQGGLIYPALPNGKEYADFVQKVKKNWTASGTSRPLAVGYGADSNGLRNLPTPRGAGSTPVVYPFTLFQGAGWGPQYGAAKIAPLKVDQLAIPDGRSWDINEEGMSHYGLVPDVIEEARIEGGQETTDAIYRSAEAYLQMWEQTQSAAAEWRKKPLLP